MSKNLVIVPALTFVLAAFLLFSLWVAVLSLVLKAILLLAGLIAIYLVLSFVWQKIKDARQDSN